MPDLDPSRQDVSRQELDAILRSDLYSFLRAAFSVLEPGATFTRALYLDVLCHALQNVAAGKINRLVVNMPPRHLKSLVTSVIWAAWMLARKPDSKIAIVCHNDSLAGDLARKCKRLIDSDWYQRFAPQVRVRNDRLRDFDTTAGGGVFSASIGSGITGRGFDIIILDDPQAANDVRSPVERESVQVLFDGSISSRLDDQVRGVIVIVQQRLHEDDLSGHVLARGGWTSITMPLVASEAITFSTSNGVWHRGAGNILCEERFPRDKIDDLRAQIGAQNFETQYQQRPGSSVGDLIKAEYLRSISDRPPSATRFFVTADTAMKASAVADYTVFLVIATDGRHHYVVDAIRGHYDVAEMRDIGLRLHQQYRLDKFLIEDSASGPSLCALLKERGRLAELVGVGGKDKETRLQDGMHLFVEGRVFIVGDAPWTVEFRRELVGFPTVKYDDQVDAFTLYLQHIAKQAPLKAVLLSAGGRAVTAGAIAAVPRKGEHPTRPWSGQRRHRRSF